jgi:flagellar FliJ protein
MARFRFQLQPVLDARSRAEDERRRDVAALEAERRRLEDRLRSGQASITGARDDVRSALVGTVRPEALRAQANASMACMRDAQRLVLELAGVHRRLEVARAALAEAAKQRRAIEIVKERRFEAWRLEQDRREQSALDEIATNRGARAARLATEEIL